MVNTKTHTLVGCGLFDLITTGMYSSPLAVYREYIQNSFDALQSSGNPSKGRVDIKLDPPNRRIIILDNGPGLSKAAAERDLVAIANSRKQRGTDRGFRGIGRLSGLAYADRVVFRTRSAADQNVIELVWDGDTLRKYATQRRMSPNQIIHKCVTIAEIGGSDWPDHFFEVTIENVARHAAGDVLNRDLVRSYIAEVCPVPIGNKFPFSDQVKNLLEEGGNSLSSLNILLHGNETPVLRPFGSMLSISDEEKHPFTEFECFRVPAVNGQKPAAIGWLAHSDYSGAIPKRLSVRGLRAREGNIQIGNEKVFDHLFPEERFNRWCVGEVHVIDARILPNGRRDYFEPGPHTRNLERQLEPIVRNISDRCRTASAGRHKTRKLLVELEQSKTVYELATSGYLKAPDARAIVRDTLARIDNISATSFGLNGYTSNHREKIEDMKKKLIEFQPKRGRPAFGKIQSSEIGIYQKVFRVLTETSPTPEIAKRTIEEVLASA